mmetsp:Transcript_29747/g.85364  ORF Transcript_29747/g.85364 Transcript_29747/m.85364 type:complete len:827 (-) Transcript_29747:88-2568(-)
MFEVVTLAGPPVPQMQQQGGQVARQLVKVGFAEAGSSLLMTEAGDAICFDSEGTLCWGKTKKRATTKFARDQVLAFVLNLDSESPNAHTLSLFRDGVRACEPQPLPEGLRGKALFPTISFKGTMLRVNFAEPPLKPLPFKCRMLQDAAVEDVVVVSPEPLMSGQCEAVFPVGLPDEGLFEWVDQFLAKNPRHVELSHRALADWAAKSGLWRKAGTKGCNDRPEMGFGIPQLDDSSLQKLLSSVAPTLARSFVVAEVKANLTAEGRQEGIAKFPGFKRTAAVLVGAPGDEFRGRVQEAILQEKRAKAELELRKKKLEAERKRTLEANKRKALRAAKAARGEDAGEEREAEDDEMKVEEPEEVTVELTEEEKKTVFRKGALPDLPAPELAKSFARFSLPAAGEGFDEIRFEWQPQEQCEEYIRKWVLTRKATQRVEDIQPSKAFQEQYAAWQKQLAEWKKKQIDYKKAAELKKKAEAKEPKKAEEEEKEGEEKPAEIDIDELDVFSVDDVADIGDGRPLFGRFEYEDWCLLALRAEFHMMLHAFRREVDDPERTTFHESHLVYYYFRYCKKALDLKHYGLGTLRELLDMLRDALAVDGATGMLVAQLAEDSPLDNFMKLAEDHRRDRQRRLEAGDETAQLKFMKPAAVQPVRTAQPSQQQHIAWPQKVGPVQQKVGLMQPKVVPQQQQALAQKLAQAQQQQQQPGKLMSAIAPRFAAAVAAAQLQQAQMRPQGAQQARPQAMIRPPAGQMATIRPPQAAGAQTPRPQAPGQVIVPPRNQVVPALRPAAPAQQQVGLKRPLTPSPVVPKVNTIQPVLKQAKITPVFGNK